MYQKQEIEYGDWVYVNGNIECAYKVMRTHQTTEGLKAEILSNNGVRLLELIRDLQLITNVEKIHELETEFEMGS